MGQIQLRAVLEQIMPMCWLAARGEEVATLAEVCGIWRIVYPPRRRARARSRQELVTPVTCHRRAVMIGSRSPIYRLCPPDVRGHGVAGLERRGVPHSCRQKGSRITRP